MVLQWGSKDGTRTNLIRTATMRTASLCPTLWVSTHRQFTRSTKVFRSTRIIMPPAWLTLEAGHKKKNSYTTAISASNMSFERGQSERRQRGQKINLKKTENKGAFVYIVEGPDQTLDMQTTPSSTLSLCHHSAYPQACGAASTVAKSISSSANAARRRLSTPPRPPRSHPKVAVHSSGPNLTPG